MQKIVGVFFLVLVASASAWSFSSLFGAEEKTEGQKSDVILNKEGFEAADPSKDSENVAGEKNPIADKVINKENSKESLKDEDGQLVHGIVYPPKAEDPSKNSENEAGENKPNVEEVTNREDSKESKKDKKDPIKTVEDDQLVRNPTALTNSKDQKIKIGDEQNFRTGKHFQFNKNIYNAGRFKPHRSQGFYQPKSHSFYQNPIRFGYPGYPFGVPQQYSSFYQPQQPFNSFLNYPLRNQQLYQPLANYQQNNPSGYPIQQKVKHYKPFANYWQQKPIFPQQNKNKKQQKSVIRPNFRLNYPYLDDSLAVDDEFYFPKEDYEKEETVFAKDAQTNDDGFETTEEEENKFIDSLTPQQINRLLDLLIEST